MYRLIVKSTRSYQIHQFSSQKCHILNIYLHVQSLLLLLFYSITRTCEHFLLRTEKNSSSCLLNLNNKGSTVPIQSSYNSPPRLTICIKAH